MATTTSGPALARGSWRLFINLLPKIGPLKTYAFNLPDAAGEKQFHRSYRASLARFAALARQQPADTAAHPPLPDTNLDTGQPTRPAAYALADQTYGELLRELHQHKFEHLTPALRQALLAYFAQGVPTPTQENEHHDDKDACRDKKTRRATEEALAALRALP